MSRRTASHCRVGSAQAGTGKSACRRATSDRTPRSRIARRKDRCGHLCRPRAGRCRRRSSSTTQCPCRQCRARGTAQRVRPAIPWHPARRRARFPGRYRRRNRSACPFHPGFGCRGSGVSRDPGRRQVLGQEQRLVLPCASSASCCVNTDAHRGAVHTTSTANPMAAAAQAFLATPKLPVAQIDGRSLRSSRQLDACAAKIPQKGILPAPSRRAADRLRRNPSRAARNPEARRPSAHVLDRGSAGASLLRRQRAGRCTVRSTPAGSLRPRRRPRAASASSPRRRERRRKLHIGGWVFP